MENKHPENHPNSYSAREQAFSDARVAVASLCANDRSLEYKAAVMEALRALESPAQSEVVASIPDEMMWAAAAAEAGTQKVPPYGFPVIVLPRPADVAAIYRAILRRISTGSAVPTGSTNQEQHRPTQATLVS